MDLSHLLAAPSVIKTPRLRLEHPRPEHAAIVMASVNASLGEFRFIEWAQSAFTVERAHRFCARDAALVASGDCLIYFAFQSESGDFVGNLDLHSFDFTVPRCEIGYAGDARLSGRGLMFEAATAVLKLGFSLGVNRIEASCDVRNRRAIRFAEQLGMQREGVLRAHSRDPQCALSDDVLLSIVSSDPWPEWSPKLS